MLDYIASKTERIQTRRRKKILLYIASGVCLGLLVGAFFLLRSGIFEVKKINIPSMHSVSSDDIRVHIEKTFASESQFISWLLGKRNILTMPSRTLSASLLDTFPSLHKANIEKNILTQSIDILVEEREKAGVWCFQNETNCVWFDKHGVAFLDDFQIEGNLLYQVVDTTERVIQLGEEVVPRHTLEKIFTIYTFLEKTSWNTKKLLLKDRNLDEIETPRIQDTPAIYFSIANNPLYAVQTVENIKHKASEYIDLRVEGRVYYK